MLAKILFVAVLATIANAFSLGDIIQSIESEFTQISASITTTSDDTAADTAADASTDVSDDGAADTAADASTDDSDDEGVVEQHIVESVDGDTKVIGLRDVLVTKDDNAEQDDSGIVSRQDDEQDDETCEIMMTEEVDEETGEVKQVYVSDCSDLDAKQYKDEFKAIMDRTKALNKVYTAAKEGRSPLTLGGRNFRKQTHSQEMQSNIERIRLAARPTSAPAFKRGDLSSRASLIARLRSLYGRNKKVYTLTPRPSRVDHSSYITRDEE